MRKLLLSAIVLSAITLLACSPRQLANSHSWDPAKFDKPGQYDKLLEHARESTRIDPTFADGWFWLGVGHFRKSSYDEAIPAFRKAIELGLPTSSSYKFLGGSYTHMGNYDDALRNINKAIDLDPKDWDALNARGWAYYYKGDFNGAKKDFNEAIENIKPDNKVNLQNALRGKAFSYLGLEDGATAINIINKAREALDYDARGDLSLIYYVTGDKGKAWELRGGKGMVGASIKDYKNGNVSGAEVVKIIADTPAERAGMLSGDIIISLNDADIAGMADFSKGVKTLAPETTAKIKILREGTAKELELQVVSAEAIMEAEPLIAPIMSKRKTGTETITAGMPAKRLPVVPAVKSDIDDIDSIKTKPNTNAYAIVIGIEEYRQGLPKADFASNDARLMSEYLTKVMGYPEENVVTLINDRALKSDMEKYFEKWLSNNVEKGGTVFVYYSGHGAPNTKTGDAYIVPYDGDPSFIEETGFSLKRLYSSLEKLDAKEITVALDSCFSGAGGRSVIAKGSRPLVMNTAKTAPVSGKLTVLSAAGGDQTSSTYDEKGHGLFTYFMLKGLKGAGDSDGDGSIDAEELYSYLKPQVERIARKLYNNEQSPLMDAPQGGQRLVLVEAGR